MNPIEYKRLFIEEMFKRGEYIKQVNDVQYRTRCPHCGDSQKSLSTGHYYFRCSLTDNYPIVYQCKRCPASGVITKSELKILGISNPLLLNESKDMKQKFSPISGLQKKGSNFIDFDFHIAQNKKYRNKIKYITDRIGIEPDEEMISDIKVVTSLKEFLIENKIRTLTGEPWMAQMLEDNYIGFLSYGNSHILFRDVTNTMQYSWIKYPIIHESLNNYVNYSVASAVDIFTDETITINLSEGVMDAISICYNLNYNKPNCINIAVCGKSYERTIKNLIGKGIVGGNVILNIFSDNDKVFNKKKNNFNYDTTIPYYRKILHPYVFLFKEVNVYYNRAYKDYGITKDKINLEKHRINP